MRHEPPVPLEELPQESELITALNETFEAYATNLADDIPIGKIEEQDPSLYDPEWHKEVVEADTRYKHIIAFGAAKRAMLSNRHQTGEMRKLMIGLREQMRQYPRFSDKTVQEKILREIQEETYTYQGFLATPVAPEPEPEKD
jgi:hypothetical protein